ncbi:MAG: translation initiation factor IF-2 [Myxococcota bacterium]
MTQLRVYELAKKLKMANTDLLKKLRAGGMSVRTHSSNVDEQEAYKALGLSQAKAQQNPSRPRTLLRKRHNEPVVDEQETPAAAQEIPDVKQEKLEMKQPTATATPPPVETLPPTEKSEKPAVPVDEPPPPAELTSADKAKESGASVSVVRVIDANSIRARLAREGRNFDYAGKKHASAASSSPARVREVTIGAAVPPAAAKPGLPGSGRNTPGKRRSGNQWPQRGQEKGDWQDLWAPKTKKKKSAKTKEPQQPTTMQPHAHKRVIELSGPMAVSELAHHMSVKASAVVAKLMEMGMMVTINQSVDQETATLVAGEFGFETKDVSFQESTLLDTAVKQDPSNLKPRPPVVTVMGHVDHGKTTLLDALRQEGVASSEYGGITQHIGAYDVKTPHGQVTFLDTPGHEAFTAMRARGAQLTDIVVLVVAADDGVMPQTKEAIDHAKAAKVPIVVALNKMDAGGAQPQKVLQQLSEYGVVTEQWGGDVQVFEISAKKKQGLRELLDGIAVQAEIMNLQANPDCKAQGLVVEAQLDKGRGPLVTLLLQSGTLKQGDWIVAGPYSGRVRLLLDCQGKPLKQVGPCIPAQLLGLSGVPKPGDSCHSVEGDRVAKLIASHRSQQQREQELLHSGGASLENVLQKTDEKGSKLLRLVIKTDVFGSLEAIQAAVKGLSTSQSQVDVEIVHSGVGTITESNVELALTTGAHIIGFHTKPDSKAQKRALRSKLTIYSCNVIYEMLDQIRHLMQSLLEPVFEEVPLGQAQVRQVFSVSKLGKIAGCIVTQGAVARSAHVRVKRGAELLCTSRITGLRRFKDDVRRVESGYECGIEVERFHDWQEGDILECFEHKQTQAKLAE